MIANRKKVLVTGAEGFIGSELCRQLADAGYPLVKLSRSPAKKSDSETFGNEFATQDFSGDILDRDLLDRAVSGVQVVFHLAGIAHVDGPSAEYLHSVNVKGTTTLTEAAVAAGVEKIIYFSSSLAAAAERNLPEQTAYGRSKYRAEQSLLTITRDTSLKATVLRPVNVYGSGMKGNLAAMIRLIGRGVLPPLPKTDTQLSLVGVQDLCAAALLAAESEQANNKIYSVTDGQVYRLNDIEAAIYQALGRNKPRWHSPRGLYFLAAATAGLLNRLGLVKTSVGTRSYRNLIADNVFSNQQICDELDFNPRQTFYTALPNLVDVK
ncbi:MAG: SDR family NAD(P)-dependent oxidoreductase [Gammaproteobacteria bacterium]|nr:SDR family NAD(P)-dependent oxidoreductase [Gammaproteobacteria bacterium]